MTKSAKYLDDGGTAYTITVPDWVDGIANTLTGLAVAGSDPVLPKGFRVRGVFAKDAGGGARRFIPCNVNGTLYDSAASQSVTIDSVAMTTTGRKGERVTFVAYASIT